MNDNNIVFYHMTVGDKLKQIQQTVWMMGVQQTVWTMIKEPREITPKVPMYP